MVKAVWAFVSCVMCSRSAAGGRSFLIFDGKKNESRSLCADCIRDVLTDALKSYQLTLEPREGEAPAVF